MVKDNRYEIVEFRGKKVDRYTRQALLACELELGYELSITQGSYNAGKVSASAGTHDRGGVVDLKPWDSVRKVQVLREIGCFAAWFRDDSEGPWPDHIHAVQVGNERLADSAGRQVTSYRNGRNGLANNGRDRGPRRLAIVPFVYVEHEHKPGARDLFEGCKGPDVAFVQKLVGVRPDRDFGPKTKAAVKSWERKKGKLLADGVVGTGTWKRMGVKVTYTPGKKKAA